MREERERLGLTQVDFAALGGAKKHSQINYEADRSSPASEYLSALAKHGVDVLYVLTGTRNPMLAQVRPVQGLIPAPVLAFAQLAENIDRLERKEPAKVPRDDLARWQRAIALIEQGLDEADLTMEPEGKAQLIVIAYDLLSDDSASSEARIIDLAKVRRG